MSNAGDIVSRRTDLGGSARSLVVMLGFAWGFNWIAAAVALREVSPWTLRFLGTGIGAATLCAAMYLSGRKFAVSFRELAHIAFAGFFNVAFFNICSAFAQLSGATSRAVIITYSMPIWSAALGWLVLRDRLDKTRVTALGLCTAGLTILVWPLVAHGAPIGVLFSLGCAFAWTIATVYMKWADIAVEPLVNAAWQLIVGEIVIAIGMLVFEGQPQIWPLHPASVAAIVYIGIFGVGLAHFLWWAIVGKLPAVTAALGSLLVPVVGVSASTVILGERPTLNDAAGFVLIFAAAACVLLQPNARRTEMPE
ncbi:MAG TPA: EamA family transporter [Pseudolabrys sp.]|nr:EamA family transporter [Pseudolabrys sp.]